MREIVGHGHDNATIEAHLSAPGDEGIIDRPGMAMDPESVLARSDLTAHGADRLEAMRAQRDFYEKRDRLDRLKRRVNWFFQAWPF